MDRYPTEGIATDDRKRLAETTERLVREDVGEIRGELADLHEMLDLLSDRLDSLGNRIVPVLMPSSDDAVARDGEPEREPRTEVGQSVRQARIKVRRYTEQIVELTSRVDL